jgi:hypothetical protein
LFVERIAQRHYSQALLTIELTSDFADDPPKFTGSSPWELLDGIEFEGHIVPQEMVHAVVDLTNIIL